MKQTIKEYLTSNGLFSKKEVYELIEDKKIEVNNKICNDYQLVVSDNDIVKVDGVKIKKEESKEYFLMNKPTGYLTIASENENKKTILSLLNNETKLFPVDKLDFNTSGIIILTNDSDLKNNFNNQPNIELVYKIKIEGLLRKNESQILKKGTMVNNKLTIPVRVKDVEYDLEHETSTIIVSTKNYKDKEVINAINAINHKVKSIKRIKYANLNLDLDTGCYRKLKPHEIKLLKLISLGKIEK